MDGGGGQSLNTSSSNGSSQQQYQRRRLTKKPPSSSYHHSSSTSFDGRTIDTQSLQSKRSSTSLRRVPSAHQDRSSHPSYATSSNSSSPRHLASAGLPAVANQSQLIPSPILPGSEFPTSDYQPYQLQAQKQQHHSHYHHSPQHSHQLASSKQHSFQSHNPQTPSIAAAASAAAYAPSTRLHNRSESAKEAFSQRGPLTFPSEEFVGAPFDGAAILNRIQETATPVQHHQAQHSLLSANQFYALQPTRHAPAPPTQPYSDGGSRDIASAMPTTAFAGGASAGGSGSQMHNANATITATTTTSVVSAPVTAAASPTPSNEMSEKTPSAPQTSTGKGPDSQFLASKRFSDEAKELKGPGVLRKKSGFSGFMTSLVGSPKKPLISMPENPVHLTHVGYDSNTGQFTVCDPFHSSVALTSPPFLVLILCNRVCRKSGND